MNNNENLTSRTMSSVTPIKFIETTKFPIDLVNDKSGGEKQGGGRPPFWEMVFWWTRKPLIGARAVIAAALLPQDVSVEEFKRMVMLNENVPHRYNPSIPEKYRKYFEGKKMLDPFAGFGCIPLEGLRLGLDVTASELLPTAYIFLKAVLDYPFKYRNKLKEDVERWGKWITEKLKDDEDIKVLYDEDVAVYIGTWEVKCPHCGKWSPLVGNWLLARVKNTKGKYNRLAYMDYKRGNEGIEIKVVDVNRDVEKTMKGKITDIIGNAKVDTNKGEIVAGSNRYTVSMSNIDSKREQATCLNCGNIIKFVDSNGSHYTDKKDAPKEKRDELEWYVKWALKKYNEGNEDYARQRLLVKVKVVEEDLVFEPCDEKDNEKLEMAKAKIKVLEEKGDVDIPSESIPFYDPRGSIWVMRYGFTLWRHLFNPRQLLTLVKLVKLIREVGKKVEEEKIKDGWNEKDVKWYAEGVVTYLSVALVRYIGYNTICTVWNYGGQLPAQVAYTISDRGIAMKWNWGDVNPCIKMSGTGTYLGNLEKMTSKIIPYLAYSTIQKTFAQIPKQSSIRVVICDATTLNFENKFDLIVTDPPYADDVPYTEISDFYYVWLKRALSDVENGKLVPRYHPEAFFKKIGNKYVEIKTQWQEFAKREVSTIAERFEDEGNSQKKAEEHFQNLLTQSFILMREHLKEDGLLVTYYAHTSPEAWANLLEAGWKGAKARITNAFPLATESAQRVNARGKLALDTSIVVVWRVVEQEKERNILDLRDEIISSAKNRAKELINQGYFGRDVLIGTMASALSTVTMHKGLYDGKGDLTVSRLLTEYVYPFTAVGIAESLREIAKVGEIKSPEVLFYLLVKSIFGSKEEMIVKNMDRSDINLLKISTKVDIDKLIDESIIKIVKEGFRLQEPTSRDISVLERFLREERRINLGRPEIRNPLDLLHLMEYYSQLLPTSKLKERWEEMKEEYSVEAEEAFTLFNILSQVLPEVDPERKLTGEFVGKIKGERLEV
ncbi:MAG: DUF1156 domain-containing protein [Candidatus Micrarchaeaceae archaeon]